MTDDYGWAALGIRPDFTGFGPAVSRGVEGPLERAGRSGGSKLVGGLRSTVRRGASSIIAPVASAFAAYKIFDLGRDSLAEARESQKVNALTSSTLRNLGKDATISAAGIGNLATSLSKKAAIDDEAIQAGLNYLLTQRTIRNEVGKGNKIFNRAAKDAVDYAAALGGQNGGTANVAGAARFVGRALADPEKALARLTRAGVNFTQQQQDSIKAFMAQGDIVSAQKVLLAGLESRYKGAAESQATLGEKVSVAWKNIEEQIGTAALPLVDDVERAILRKGIPTARKWADEFSEHGVPAIRDFADVVEDRGIPMLEGLVDKGKPLAREVLPAIGTALSTSRDALEAAAPYAERMVGAFNDAPDWVKKGTVFAGLAALAGKKFGLFDRGRGGQSAAGNLLSGAPGSLRNPLYVIQVDGKGGGIGGAAGKATGVASKLALPVALGALAFEAVDMFHDKAEGGGARERLHASNVAQQNSDRYRELFRDQYGHYPAPGEKGPTADYFKAIEGGVYTAKLDLDTKRADAKNDTFRRKVGKPIEVPIVAEVTTALEDFFSEAFGGDSSSKGRGRRDRGGVTVNIDKMVAQDYRDMQRQVQQRAQQAGLGGRPTAGHR